MNRRKYHSGFFGLAAAVLLMGATSLARADNMSYWNTTGPADWSSASNWTSNSYTSFNWWAGATVINNGGTATITAGDNVTITDSSNEANFFVGGGSATIGGIGGNGNGYVTMTGGSLDGAAIDGGYGMQEVIGIAPGGSGIFTQSGGTNMSMVHFYDSQRYFSALSLGFVPGAFGQYNLQGGHLNAPAIFVGGNTNQVQDHTVSDAGTGVFVQTGGSVGTLAVAGSGTQAVGLAVGGNWMGTASSSIRLYTTWPSGHTPSAAPAAPARDLGRRRRRHRG